MVLRYSRYTVYSWYKNKKSADSNFLTASDSSGPISGSNIDEILCVSSHRFYSVGGVLLFGNPREMMGQSKRVLGTSLSVRFISQLGNRKRKGVGLTRYWSFSKISNPVYGFFEIF